MSDTLASLRHKISGAGDLKSVVRSMKALAASSIGQYENSVLALADYDRTIELGLAVCLRNRQGAACSSRRGNQRGCKSGHRHRLRLGSGTGRPVQ